MEDTLVYGCEREVSESAAWKDDLSLVGEAEYPEDHLGNDGWTSKDRFHLSHHRHNVQLETFCQETSESPEQKFRRLAAEWKSKRGPVSSPMKLVMHPAYQSIIGMGQVAVPLMLRALEQELDLWFLALRAITEADPVPSSSRGRMKEMAEAWLKWGRKYGYR